MKQALLAISMLFAAFIVACSQGKTTIAIKSGNGGNGKTVEQLDKLSTDDELKKLKKQLEDKKDLTAADVIQAVKSKFGSKPKPPPKPKKDGKGDDVVILEKTTEFEVNLRPADNDLKNIQVMSMEESEQVKTTLLEGGDESKNVCIRTCEIQIVIIKKKNEGKVTDVKAYVAMDFPNVAHYESNNSDIMLNQIAAAYAASNDQMVMKFSGTKKDKGVVLNSDQFAFVATTAPQGHFKDEKGLLSGEFEVIGTAEERYVKLVTEGGSVITQFSDLGLFKKASNPL